MIHAITEAPERTRLRSVWALFREYPGLPVTLMIGGGFLLWGLVRVVLSSFGVFPLTEVKQLASLVLTFACALIWLLAWVAYVVLLNVRWLRAVARRQAAKLDELRAANTVGPSRSPLWPWGEHHTQLLGHLDAAAREWWSTYDPADPATAPTSEMVAGWLHAERGVSREKAKAIASILRPDDLRTGRRGTPERDSA